MNEIRRTILYIEDDPASREVVLRALEQAGYEVLLAERGLEGIDLARKMTPDLILTDIRLPDLNGREVATMLRKNSQFRDTPIVAITAYDHTGEREMALAAGLDGYIVKPINVDDFQKRIAFYLNGGQDDIEPERLDAARERYLETVVAELEGRIRQLEEANKSLYQLDKMKDAFIQLTAHELRTPLTLIYGYSRLLEDHPPLKALMTQDKNIAELIGGLVESINRMYETIEELLIMSRIMTNQIELTIKPTNLGMIVAKILKEYEEALKSRNIRVIWDQSEWPISMRADPDLLRVAVENLLSNAIKFTPDGGAIRLKAQMDGQYVYFSIRDSGVGIAKEQQEAIFESFHTTRDVLTHTTSKTAFEGGGLGLGLPICKGIITAHGGRIRVESEGHDPNTLPGSEFIVVLPLITRVKGQKAPTKSAIFKLSPKPQGKEA